MYLAISHRIAKIVRYIKVFLLMEKIFFTVSTLKHCKSVIIKFSLKVKCQYWSVMVSFGKLFDKTINAR